MTSVVVVVSGTATIGWSVRGSCLGVVGRGTTTVVVGAEDDVVTSGSVARRRLTSWLTAAELPTTATATNRTPAVTFQPRGHVRRRRGIRVGGICRGSSDPKL